MVYKYNLDEPEGFSVEHLYNGNIKDKNYIKTTYILRYPTNDESNQPGKYSYACIKLPQHNLCLYNYYAILAKNSCTYSKLIAIRRIHNYAYTIYTHKHIANINTTHTYTRKHTYARTHTLTHTLTRAQGAYTRIRTNSKHALTYTQATCAYPHSDTNTRTLMYTLEYMQT